MLKQLTVRGTTVLCTIHQPSSEIFQLFDNLILLSLGRQVFAGPLTDAKKFFTEQGLPCHDDYNPADHYIWETSVSVADNETSTKQIHALADAFESSEYEQKNRSLRKLASVNAQEDVFIGYSPPTLAVQLKVLMWRAAIAKYKDKFILLLQLQQNLMTALIFGLVFLRVPRRLGFRHK